MYIKYTIIVKSEKAIPDNIDNNKIPKNMSNIVDIGVFHLA